jgi:hypothetical protein
MKSIYESAKQVIEGSYKNKGMPRVSSIGPDQGSMADRQSGIIEPIDPFPAVRGPARAPTYSYGDRSAAFKYAAKIDKQNPVTSPSAPKVTSNELPSVKSSKGLGVDSYTSPAPVVKKGPTGSEKIPLDAAVPAYIRQNKSDPVLTDKSTIDKSSKDKKAIDLMVRMDQMQKQGIGQTKPKVSADYYKNLKAAGMKTSNESRMSSAYSTIKRILGEKHNNSDELKEYQDRKDVLVEEPPINKPLSAISTGSLGNRIDVKRVDLEKNVSRGSQNKYITSKAIKGNAEMKKKEAEAAKKAATLKPITSTIPGVEKAPPAPAPAQSVMAPAPKTTVSREAEKSGPDVQGMKKGIAANQTYDKPIDTVTATKDNAASEKPVEAPTVKPQANQASDNKLSIPTLKLRDPTEPKNPMPGIFHPKSLGDKRQVRDNSAVDPVTNKPLDDKPGISSAQADQPKTKSEPEPKPQAAASAPSSPEFKFSADQEKWLGKANRQDPYVINRMPGTSDEKPSVQYFKDPKDQEIARKINKGIDNVNAVKNVFKSDPNKSETDKEISKMAQSYTDSKKNKTVKEEKMENINKKFNITDALYQSVMEVMKKDKKEGSVPRNDKEEDLAKFHGDPKRITHGDVLKARGVTKEEVVQQDEEKGMTRGTRPRTASPGFGKDDYKPLIPDTEKPGSARVSPDGNTVKADSKGKMKPSSGDPEGVKENKDTPGNSYEHQCAIHVKSESFGEGRTITTQHASPDADGNIEWYDVMFEHGIERYVPTNTLEILVSEMHMHSKKKKKMM